MYIKNFDRLTLLCFVKYKGADFFLTVDEAKKVLSGNLSIVSIEILQEAAKIVALELVKAEEKNLFFKKFEKNRKSFLRSLKKILKKMRNFIKSAINIRVHLFLILQISLV